MADKYATSFETPNYSGMLFNKGNTKTPLSTMIGARKKYTGSVEFVTGQEYETAQGSQPEISENASLNAPDSSIITREQKTNVTQIFQETVGISYAKESNMGTLSGLNVAGQQANPASELDFQVAAKMAKIAQDIEYTFINGVYQKSTNDSIPNKTRGLLPAIESNVIDAEGKPLSFLMLCELLKLIDDSNGSLDDLIVGLDSTSRMQLNVDAATNGLTIAEGNRTVNGIAVDTVLTPLGVVGLRNLKYLPSGTIVTFDPDYLSPVEMIVPGKGNFFMEELAKVGAGKKNQIFGQMGLDHGPEWYAGKITGLSTVMPKEMVRTVKVYNSGIDTPESLGELSIVSAAGTNVGDTKITVTPAKDSGNSYKYKVAGSPTLPVLNQVCTTGYTAWDGAADITAVSGQKIVVVEIDADNKAKKAGMAVVVSKA